MLCHETSKEIHIFFLSGEIFIINVQRDFYYYAIIMQRFIFSQKLEMITGNLKTTSIPNSVILNESETARADTCVSVFRWHI